MTSDHDRLSSLLERLRAFELRLPLPHERAIVEVARAALRDEIQLLSQRLHAGSYWRRSAPQSLRAVAGDHRRPEGRPAA